ncbi:unnamed protein product [Adineta steineri]|uniref:Nuclear receptor domain-containing protein n=1 Tax=Adineta steineri TaxID=433720 RepID=A0A813M5I5_9BILA|nr:unnamed protein product [Adineta steineri]CAF3758007.1 unnamed protein product [Adineta steineri]
MAGHRKMIIITSDEDLIRQVVSNKTKNTRIIDWIDDSDDTDASFLAQLSEVNSTRDQVYKRALDSSHNEQSKQAKLSKKSLDIICAICGDRANGFNYNVLSCASCKAFFLRNANQQSKRIRCITGQNQCSVAHEIQRKCPQCRLNRCFAAGMRQDFLLSDEVKQRRKKPTKDKRNGSSQRSSTADPINPTSQFLTNSEPLDDIDRLLMDIDENLDLNNELEDISLGTLSIEEWITIENIRSSFLLIFQNEDKGCPCFDMSSRANALISWSQFINRVALKFITFFRQIDEFENLHDDDRFLLIKYNLHPNFSLFKSVIYKPYNDCCLTDNNHMAVRQYQFYNLCGDSYGIREAYIHMISSIVQATDQDPIFLSLLSTIFIFTQGLAINDEGLLLKDPLAVYRAQSHYTTLLWKYLVSKQGEIQARRHFTQLLTTIFQIQLVCRRFQQFFRTQIISCDTADKVAPIMQTVLQIY